MFWIIMVPINFSSLIKIPDWWITYGYSYSVKHHFKTVLLVLHLKYKNHKIIYLFLNFKESCRSWKKLNIFFLKNGWCEARENWLKMIREFSEEQFIKADDFKNQSVSFIWKFLWFLEFSSFQVQSENPYMTLSQFEGVRG